MSFRGGWELGRGLPSRDSGPSATGLVGFMAAHLVWPAVFGLAAYGLFCLIVTAFKETAP